MKSEFWTVLACGIFFLFISPVYWVLTQEPTGTVVLAMTMLLCVMLSGYLAFVAKEIPNRPEDNSDGEISDGAGELGFFPPWSWWPLWCALAFAGLMLGIVFGWWMVILVVPFGAIAIWGWVFEYYRGIHSH